MGAKCTVCGEGEIVERDGRFGKFYSCNKYPKCKTVFDMDEDGNFSVKQRKVAKTTGKKCPECGKAGRDGELIERSNKSSGNKFLGCSAYPKCKYSEPLDSDSKPKTAKKNVEKDEEDDEGSGEDLSLDI